MCREAQHPVACGLNGHHFIHGQCASMHNDHAILVPPANCTHNRATLKAAEQKMTGMHAGTHLAGAVAQAADVQASWREL